MSAKKSEEGKKTNIKYGWRLVTKQLKPERERNQAGEMVREREKDAKSVKYAKPLRKKSITAKVSIFTRTIKAGISNYGYVFA